MGKKSSAKTPEGRPQGKKVLKGAAKCGKAQKPKVWPERAAQAADHISLAKLTCAELTGQGCGPGPDRVRAPLLQPTPDSPLMRDGVRRVIEHAKTGKTVAEIAAARGKGRGRLD